MHKRLRFFEKDTVDWNGPSLMSFYHSVIALKHETAALANGAEGGAQMRLDTDGGPRVYAFSRVRSGSAIVVAVNFGDTEAHAHYTGLSRTGGFTDWFSRAPVTLGASGTLDIPAHGYKVLVQ